MQCPSCQNTDSRVLESRSADSGKSVRRRRECLNCTFRFTTYERVETVPINVLKQNGSRETFSRNKIINGISKAAEKTVLNNERIELLVDKIEAKLQQRNSKEINSSEIGEMVLNQLKNNNEVAYIRFASVYREFHGINDFVATLKAFDPSNKDQLATVL
tara:strand:+ start:236 stop:715 length:480 start_codon:yes stop_codon:yes gene_type:complete